jgi:hypothetical protein
MPLGETGATLTMPKAQDPPTEVVRAWVHAVLAGLPESARLPAVLLTEELVTNARRHGRAPYVLRFSAPGLRRSLRVLVEDSAPDTGGSWMIGSGLVLVGALSRRWGVERRARGKTVWAELGLDAPVRDFAAPAQPRPRW